MVRVFVGLTTRLSPSPAVVSWNASTTFCALASYALPSQLIAAASKTAAVPKLILVPLTVPWIEKPSELAPLKEINTLTLSYYLSILVLFLFIPLIFSNYGIALRYKWLIIPYFLLAFLDLRKKIK